MHVSPTVYRLLVHPSIYTKWFAKRYLQPSFELGGKQVLDFGCGTGGNCCVIAADLYLGVDIDEERIEYARRLYPDRRFAVVSPELREIGDRAFDVILIGAVLHHLTDEQIAGYENEFLRILKPDGALIVFEPYLAPKARLINWFMRTLDEGKYLRTEEEYLALFRGNFQPCILRRFRLPYLSSMILLTATRLR
jgi:SAM-dependent methyltransferase